MHELSRRAVVCCLVKGVSIMVKRTGLLMLTVAAVGLVLASAGDAKAFGRRGGGGSGGSSGCYGSNGGSYGSGGSYGGRHRHRHRGNGSSGGSYGGSSCNDCDSGGDNNCGCDASSSDDDDRDRDGDRGRGERHEARYHGEQTYDSDSDQRMAAPDYAERRGDRDRE